MAAKKKLRQQPSTWVRTSILTLCCLGTVVAAYACYVEISKERDHSYKALCDISETISCSKVFTSRWGRGFGLVDRVFGRDSWLNQPNSVFGMAFYAFQTRLAFKSTKAAAIASLAASVVSNMGSVYLSYILFFVLNDFCIICVSMYVLNFLLLISCIFKYRHAVAMDSKKKS